MSYRLAVVSALTLANVVGSYFTAPVFAENVEIPFSGTVQPSATFSAPTPGDATPTSTGSGINLNTFHSTTPATLSVNVATPATIAVSPPTLQSGPTSDPPGTTHIGFLRFGNTDIRSDVNGGSASLPSGSTDLFVDIDVQRPEKFEPGTYTYVVTLTVTP